MAGLNRNRFDTCCGERVRNFYALIDQAVCRNQADVHSAFKSFQMKMLDGVVFHTSQALSKSGLLLAEAVVEFVGSGKSSIPEIRELGYRVFADFALEETEPSQKQYLDRFFMSLEEHVNRTYRYVGPCNIFLLEEDVTALRSDVISVVRATEFLEYAQIPKGGKNWAVRLDETFGDYTTDGMHIVTVGGPCWDIDTRCPKANARSQAVWMAGVFTSLFRVALDQADYCHRATIGQLEPSPTVNQLHRDVGAVYDEKTVHWGGFSHIPQYRVTKRVSESFHSDVFQSKVRLIFNPPRKSLAERIADGLGWLSRGRQSSDISERLLHFFTALEALFSDGDTFVPVADTIARCVSIVLSNEPKPRSEIYAQMRKLYRLRSSLVHRGSRSAHMLNANNVQHYAEACYGIVIREVDLSQSHKLFLEVLRAASHGAKWPLPKAE